MSEGKYILAAGGLLERPAQGGVQIALVRRTRYEGADGSAGDVVLPKGKLNAGESLEEAALREVLEETGCVGRLVGIAMETEYEVESVPKLVSFFRMELTSEGPVRDASEVRRVRWVTPHDALTELTYEREREVVRRVYRVGPEREES
jgi:8-oxo-dGTP diphosphatase